MLIYRHRKQGGAHSQPRPPVMKTWLEDPRRTRDHILSLRSCNHIKDANKDETFNGTWERRDVRVNGRNRKLVILYNTNFIALTPYKKMNVLCYYSSLPLKILSKLLHLIITPLLGILQPPSLPGNSYLFYNIKFTWPPSSEKSSQTDGCA